MEESESLEIIAVLLLQVVVALQGGAGLPNLIAVVFCSGQS